MRALVGTGRLVRLALRRDRVRLPVWLAALVGLAAAVVNSVQSLYTTAQAREEAAAFSAASVATRMVNGPASGTDMGALAMFEAYGVLSTLVALLSIQTVLRHTRQDEDTGRAELLGSTAIGRHAPLTAAMLVGAAANAATAAGVAAVLLGQGLAPAGSVASGLTFGAVGLFFTGVAAVAAQVMASQRAATAVSVLVLGAAYLLRGAGDALGEVGPNGVFLTSAWPSWLSPVGWGQQLRPFAQDNWEVFGLFAGAFVLLVAAAHILVRLRDSGAGMLGVRTGPARAPATLRGPLGLAWRLQRGALAGWCLGMLVIGASFGAIGDNVADVVGISAQFEELLRGGHRGASLVDTYFVFVVGFLSIAVAGYSVQAVLRARSEEASGHAEPVLAASVGRRAWLGSHVLVAACGSVLVLLALGASGAVAYAVASGDAHAALGMVGAAAAQAPAVFVLGAVVVAADGFLPRAATAIGWTALAVSLVLGQLGELFELPQAVLDASPFTHTPEVPAGSVAWTPVVTLLVVAAVLTAAGMARFRRRDLAGGA